MIRKENEMNRETFSDILKECDFSEEQIELLWLSKPDVALNEQRLRETARHIRPVKDVLIQR